MLPAPTLHLRPLNKFFLMTTFLFRAVAVCVLMAAMALPSQAVMTTPLLHPLFTDNMVLQRDASDPVRGWATPGTTAASAPYIRQFKATRGTAASTPQSTFLGGVDTLQDNIAGTVQVTDVGAAAQPKRFYRIVVGS